jgi:hypothetical protein
MAGVEINSVEDAERALEERPELAARLSAGEPAAIVEYFELTGAKVTSTTVRELV